MRVRKALAPSLLFVAATLVSACGATANITDVYTALDSDGARRRNEFFTDTKEIHCVAEAGVGRGDATIEGVIRQTAIYDAESDGFVSTDRVVGYLELNPQPTNGPLKIGLALTKVGPDGKPADDAPYVAGSYKCEMSLDGDLKGEAKFNIDFPPCPPAQIAPGSPCIGFYKENTECPAFGDSSSDAARCTCEAGGWKCG